MSDYPQQDNEQPPLCLKRLLGTPPLAAVSQVPAVRGFGLTAAFFLLLGVLATFTRNADGFRWASFVHLGSVSLLLLLSSSFVSLNGRHRLLGIALVLILSSYVSHIRHADIAWGLLIVVAAGSVLHLCLSTLAATGLHALTIVGHGLVSLRLGSETPLDVAVTAVAALVITSVPAILVRFVVFHLESERLAAERRIEQISQLLAERSRLMSVITQEVRLPLMSMALVLDGEAIDKRAVERLRASVEQLRLVVDNLFNSDSLQSDTPRRSEIFSMKSLVTQTGIQLTPLIESEGGILYTDITTDASVDVYGDRARVRAILHNLVRNTSHYGAGNRIWLNVHEGGTEPSHRLTIIIDVETNEMQSSSALREVVEADPDFRTYELGSVALGMEVAKQWLHQLDGELIWYRSPRGGDGIRATLSLPLAPDPSTEAAVAASERSIAAGSLGVSV